MLICLFVYLLKMVLNILKELINNNEDIKNEFKKPVFELFKYRYEVINIYLHMLKIKGILNSLFFYLYLKLL